MLTNKVEREQKYAGGVCITVDWDTIAFSLA